MTLRRVGCVADPVVATASYDPSGMRETLKRLALRSGWHVARSTRFDLVAKGAGGYYSPRLDLENLDERVFGEPRRMHGIDLDLDRQFDFVQTDLAPHVRELDLPLTVPPGSDELHLVNGNYGPGDVELLYALVRRTRPSRVLELGSGWSSVVIARAVAANHEVGAATSHDVHDPFPRPEFERRGLQMELIDRRRAQDVPIEEFTTLRRGDILFVDTTHTVKAGGDVNFIVLEVLPQLADGVMVHFHDIFLPWEYHRAWHELGIVWAEQYLLQAFLTMNTQWEVVVATHALFREDEQRLSRAIPSIEAGACPTSFWIRRRPATA